MDIPSWLSAVAAFGTLASAIVIGWQAILTRQSIWAVNETAQATRRAADLTELSLRETQISRLESRFPRITISLSALGETGKLAVRDDDNNWVECPSNTVFKLPRDSARILRTTHLITVRNDGPYAIEFERKGTFDWTSFVSSSIEPGGSITQLVLSSKTIKEWAALSRDIEGDDYWPIAHEVAIVHEGPGDADIDEELTVQVRGSLLRESPDAVGDWVPTEDVLVWESGLRYSRLPPARTYWKSRSRGEPF